MANQTYRANLANDNFPLLSRFKGQTVIVGKTDQDYELDVNNQQKLQKEKEIPQAYYLENVMPTGQGFQSIGYTNRLAAFAGKTDFNDSFILRDVNEKKVIFSPAKGMNYVYDATTGVWASVSPIAANTGMVTTAFLSGITYVFYAKTGCFQYDPATMTFLPVVLTGIIATSIIGICAAQGFLIVWDEYTVYRGQLAAPTNFTPDFTLGSGSDRPQDAKGKIVACLQLPGGFIIYTTNNAVGATFNVNLRQPFTYAEVTGSAGISNITQVSYHDSLGHHYAWTGSGLLKVNKTAAVNIFPEVTDFLTCKIYEEWNAATLAFVETRLTTAVDIKITVTGARFLVISYGINPGAYTYALVYDIAFKRWGKLKINHVCCLEYITPNLVGDIFYTSLKELSYSDLGETTYADLALGLVTDPKAKENLGFMQSDGTVVTVNFDLNHTNDSGLLVLGKYQYVRNSFLVIDEVEVENVNSEVTNFTCLLISSLNGKTATYTKNLYLLEATDLFRRFASETTGLNHSTIFQGTFHICSLKLKFHLDGKE